MSAFRPVAPPPRPPGQVRPARQRAARDRSTRVRPWHLEAIAAVALLAILAAVFSPATPNSLSAGQRWAARSAPVILDLTRDIATLQAALPSQPGGSGLVLPPPAAGALLGLQGDLRRARAAPAPPDPTLDRAWRTGLAQAEAAVRILAGLTAGPQPSASASAATVDLDQAGQDLIAVSTAARAGTTLGPR